MIRKVLTYLTILALSVLPVQLINASAATALMQMSAQSKQSVLVKQKCLHKMTVQVAAAEKGPETAKKSCCDESSNNSCQGCNNFPHTSSAVVLPALAMVKNSLVKISELSIRHLVLNGIPQKNLLRPPRKLI
jgi:hypothetical protein